MRPTWIAVAGGSVLLLAGGFVLNTQEFVILGTLGLAAAAFAVVFTRRKIAIRVQRDIRPARVTLGGRADLVISMANDAALPSPGFIGRSHDGVRSQEFTIPPLAAHSEGTRSVRLRTDRRGVFELEPIEVLRTDPLRLAGASRRYGESATFFVHPRVHRLTPLPATSIRESDGMRADRSPHGSESFHALREYVQGDDYRLIHWKSSARGEQQLVVKQFVDLWTSEVLVVLDTRALQSTEQAFEDAVEAAASIAVASAVSRHAVTLMLGTGETATVRPGSAHHHEVLDLLAGARRGTGDDLETLSRRAASSRTYRALVLISAAPAVEILSFLSAARSFQRRVVVHIDPKVPESPYVEMSQSGDEAISAGNVADFVAGWGRLLV